MWRPLELAEVEKTPLHSSALDDPIVEWAPELANRRVLKDPAGPIDDTFPTPRDITIEDLLTHRSGFAEPFTSRRSHCGRL
jgi:CubicO group peptidase (beta-lactamase class C family)